MTVPSNEISSHQADASGAAEPSWPVVALAAWLVPGLGHVLLGQKERGLIVGATLLIVFIAGLLIGGVAVVDRQSNRLAFAGQMFIGPLAFGVDFARATLHQRRIHQIEAYADQTGLPASATADEGGDLHEGPALADMLHRGARLAYRTPIGRVQELGSLYAAVAGLMNLLVLLDAVGRTSSGDAASSAGRPGAAPQPEEESPS